MYKFVYIYIDNEPGACKNKLKFPREYAKKVMNSEQRKKTGNCGVLH